MSLSDREVPGSASATEIKILADMIDGVRMTLLALVSHLHNAGKLDAAQFAKDLRTISDRTAVELGKPGKASQLSELFVPTSLALSIELMLDEGESEGADNEQ